MEILRRLRNAINKLFCPTGKPPGWGEDHITQFLELARGNAFATFINRRGPFQRLIDIDAIYRALHSKMNNNPAWFVLLFFFKAHSAFLAAVQLAANTQVSEAYPLQRGVLEHSLYGLRIHDNPSLANVWLKRHDSADSLKAVKAAFKIGDMLTLLDQKDAALGKIVRTLYEGTIDWGAHPNERALTGSLKITESTESVSFDVVYLTNNPDLILGSLRSTAQVAIASLRILQLIIPEHFTPEIQAQLLKVSQGL